MVAHGYTLQKWDLASGVWRTVAEFRPEVVKEETVSYFLLIFKEVAISYRSITNDLELRARAREAAYNLTRQGGEYRIVQEHTYNGSEYHGYTVIWRDGNWVNQ